MKVFGVLTVRGHIILHCDATAKPKEERFSLPGGKVPPGTSAREVLSDIVRAQTGLTVTAQLPMRGQSPPFADDLELWLCAIKGIPVPKISAGESFGESEEERIAVEQLIAAVTPHTKVWGVDRIGLVTSTARLLPLGGVAAARPARLRPLDDVQRALIEYAATLCWGERKKKPRDKSVGKRINIAANGILTMGSKKGNTIVEPVPVSWS